MNAPNEDGYVWQDGGWIGRLAGRNDEYWMPLDEFLPSDLTPLFDREEIGGTLRAPVDTRGDWTVEVNGQAVGIEHLSRKSYILDTAEVVWYVFDF